MSNLTSNASDVRDVKALPLTEVEQDIVHKVESYYLMHGTFPHFSQLDRITKEDFEAALRNRAVANAFKRRGIASPMNQVGLAPVQLFVITLLLDVDDRRNNNQKFKAAGITSAQFNTWLRDPIFKTYFESRQSQVLADGKFRSHTGLLKNLDKGDLGSIKYFNKMQGIYDEDGSSVDLNLFIVQIIEILQRRIKDPNVMEQIARDIQLVTQKDRLINQREAGLGMRTPNSLVLEGEAHAV